MASRLFSSLRRLRAVASKEVRQLSRDRVTFGMIVGVPLMQMLLFGYAINFDVRSIATVVQDQANSSMSREFLAQLRATQVVNNEYVTDSPAELRFFAVGEREFLNLIFDVTNASEIWLLPELLRKRPQSELCHRHSLAGN